MTATTNLHYVYVYLDPRKLEKYIYGNYIFDYEPFYIGKGINRRAYQHLCNSSDYNKENYNLIKEIIKETGKNPEIRILHSNLSEEESLKIEAEYIDTIGRLNIKTGPLTNKRRKGNPSINNNRKILQFDLNGNFIKEWNSVLEAEILMDNGGISSCLIKFTKTSCGYFWFYKDEFKGLTPVKLDNKTVIKLTTKNNENTKQKILQFSKNNIFIKEWNSIKSASVELGVSGGSISRVCSGFKNCKTAGGFIWKYKDLNNIMKKKPKKSYKRKVNQISKDGTVIKTWNSGGEASKILKINNGQISSACIGYRNAKTAGGFIWKFLEENEEPTNLEPEIFKMPTKKIHQFSFDGEFIRTWNSIKEPSRLLKIKGSSISDVCAKRGKTAKGFIWRYATEKDGVKISNLEINEYSNKKAVYQISKNGELIKKWESISKASKLLKIQRNGISKSCKNKLNTYGGFVWEYAN